MLQSIFDRLYARRLSPAVQHVFRMFGSLRPLDRPIFLVGLNRSGTSVFTRLFAESSAIVNWSEANDLWDPRGYPWEAARRQRPFWPLDPQGYTEAILADNGDSYAAALHGICAMYVAAHHVGCNPVRFLNKSPMNTLRIELLQQLFPGACFISLVRDPRAVIRSWAEKSVPKLMKHPRSGVERAFPEAAPSAFIVDGERFTRAEFLRRLSESYCYIVRRQTELLATLPADRRFETRYEEFVADIHGVIRRIDDQFDIDPRCRRWPRIPPVQESRNVKVRTGFDAAELELVSDACRAMIERLGYAGAA
jgi:hypothetical protein